MFSQKTVELLIAAIESLLEDEDHEDLLLDERGHPIKIRYPLSKHPSFLDSLANHSLIQLIDSLFPGGDAVLTWEDVLVKQPNSGTEVLVHQDLALQTTEGNVFSIGLSLHDDSHNPVFFLPGSHHSGALTRSEVRVLGELARDSFKPVKTKSGDALVHDVRCVHFSEPMVSDSSRYTWYLEFRSETDLRRQGPWKDDWIDSRKAIWSYVRDRSSGGTEDFDGPLRIPHVTSYLSYDQTSPFNHFVDWSDDWERTRPHRDKTHHTTAEGLAIYEARYEEVLPFHPPGLAPVFDGKEWSYILPNGISAFPLVFNRAFGFYCGLAAVEEDGSWFHIKSDGTKAYETSWSWCGNFQQNRCSVRDLEGNFHHIRIDGSRLPGGPYKYPGDFREGFAVVHLYDGKCTHIDFNGEQLHKHFFNDLGVFHKGFAIALDEKGWTHIDTNGLPIYDQRYLFAEPFYNGWALVKDFDENIFHLSENGDSRSI